MQAHVKTPLTKIDILGEINPKILELLRELYGRKVKVLDDNGDELVDVFQTEWFNKVNSQMTPARNMRMYREINKMTQDELGKKLGGISRQNISHMESGVRAISKKNAKMLAEIFNVSVERFI